MSTKNAQLPPGFEALEPFVASWSIGDVVGRDQRRSQSTHAERLAFYTAASDLLAQALDYLDSKPLVDLDECEQRRMDMILSYAHVALAVEVQAGDEPKHASVRQHLRITRDGAAI